MLHERFSAYRVRGKWFELGASEIYGAVAYLISRGDEKRMLVDYE